MTVTSEPYRTSNDLVIEVLSNLGVFSVGQAVAPEDFEYVNSRLDSIFRKLGALEVVYVADSNNIPGEWFTDIGNIVTGEVASKFGATGQALVDLVNSGLGGKAGVPLGAGSSAVALKIMLRGRPTGEPQRAQYF